jgi:hypothetical protein
VDNGGLRYGAMESALRERLATVELHHGRGHDRHSHKSLHTPTFYMSKSGPFIVETDRTTAAAQAVALYHNSRDTRR